MTQLPATSSDADIIKLNDAGIRAIRFNLKRGGSESVKHMERLSKRVYELVSWHTELYVDACELPELAPVLLRLPKVSIDHLGLSQEGLSHLLKLVEKGVKVKATGFGRGNLDVKSTLQEIAKINPSALMFGTDLPSTRAKRPFDPKDIELIKEALSPEHAELALYSNAKNFYLETYDG